MQQGTSTSLEVFLSPCLWVALLPNPGFPPFTSTWHFPRRLFCTSNPNVSYVWVVEVTCFY